MAVDGRRYDRREKRGIDKRRKLLLDEVNAIGTCYLRAGMVPDAERVATRLRLRENGHLRAEMIKQPESLPQALAHMETLKD